MDIQYFDIEATRGSTLLELMANAASGIRASARVNNTFGNPTYTLPDHRGLTSARSWSTERTYVVLG